MSSFLALSAVLCVTISQAPAPASGTINVPLFHLPANGDAPYFWRGFCTAMAGVTLSAGPVPAAALPQGAAPRSCFYLGYHFPPPGKVDTAEAARFMELPECTRAITMKLLPDGSPHSIGLRLIDATKEAFQWRVGIMQLPTANGKNGHVLSTRVAIDAQTAEATWGGNADHVLDYPLSLQSLIIIREDAQPVDGQLGILSLDAEIPDPTIPADRGGKAVRLLPLADKAHPWPLVRFDKTNAEAADVKGNATDGLDIRYKWAMKKPNEYPSVIMVFGGNPQLTIPRRGTVLLQVDGDGSNSTLFAYFTDANAGVWFYPVAQHIVDFKGLGYLWLNTASTDSGYSGSAKPSPRAPTYPLKLTGLIWEKLADGGWGKGVPYAGEGEVHIKNIWFLPATAR